MFDYLITMESSVYIQLGLFALLLIYFFAYRKDPRHLVSGLSLVRTLLIFVLFSYLLWNWASAVSPPLRTASVVAMFLVNLYMLWNVVLTRLERPYRDALAACVRQGGQAADLEQVWRTGKRFYYWRYFSQALVSGAPGRFAHNLAVDQVREDLQAVLRQKGLKPELLSLKTLVGYLEQQLSRDDTLPQDFKETMRQCITEFARHAWIETHVNRFLAELLESPERLFAPDWGTLPAADLPPAGGETARS